MRKSLFLIAVLGAALPLAAYGGGPNFHKSATNDDLAALLAKLDVRTAAKQADLTLALHPKNALALFVRMEAAELEAQPEVVLDSALRLCHAALPEDVLKIASTRILKYAGNTPAFHRVLERVKAAALQQNDCSINLRLALVTAAADGEPELNLDQTTARAGVLTRWRIAGPFGRYSNADFDRKWAPESDRFSHAYYGKLQTEEFLFPDGLLNLPDYFSAPGLYYAGSDIETAQPQNALLRVFSPGPYAVFLDGRLVLAHDSRFAVSSSIDSTTIELNRGKHRVVVKLNGDAAPFRMLIQPQSRTAPARQVFDAGPLKNYIKGLGAYLRDDLPEAERVVLPDSTPAAHYLRALLFSAIEEHSADARAAWKSLGAIPLAQIKLAEISAAGPGDTAVHHNLGRELPDSEAAQQAIFATTGGEDSLRRLLALHPSCVNLSEAIKFFAASGEMEESQKLEQPLAHCAPDSLDHGKALAAEGRHKDATEYLFRLLVANPWNRPARRLLIKELLLDGREKEAVEQAESLHEIAPNSAMFARLALSPSEVLDSSSGRASGFTHQNQFYVPYRRNGLEIVRHAAGRHFSGGPSVTLLSDKVVDIQDDGLISVYTHRITRLLSKDGIARFGEVFIPRGADLLELRTIKGGARPEALAIIEPELVQQKSTISMPALEPGDNIEEEFVVHYPAWEEAPEDVSEFTFGSFAAPILYSRFVVSAPGDQPLKIWQSSTVADSRVEHARGKIIRTWEQNDIAQAAQESTLPLQDQLPFVAVSSSDDEDARLRDALIAATRVGPQVARVLPTLQQPGSSDYEKAQRLYRFISAKIQPANADWSANSAEDTLLNFEGSRTAALLALARSLGLKAELILAHKKGRPCGKDARPNCYNLPLVRFSFASGKVLDTDVESTGLAFGTTPFGLDTEDALLVDGGQTHVAIMPSVRDEKSVAEAALFLDENGNLTVNLQVRLGAARGQHVRSVLQEASARERQIFFDQMALRIFPGATDVNGSSLHQDDPEQPLELKLQCQIPQLIHPEGPWELDQLVPALGLRELYAKTAARKFPLYIDTVLFESTTFHLRLAPRLQLRSLPADFRTRNQFGEYSVEFISGAQEITIHRQFRIPAQIISPQSYQSFAGFARQIDEAERGRIGLSVAPELATSGAR